jgi:hypothetical protein
MPGRHRDVHRLVVDLIIHVAHQFFIGIDDGWYAHRAIWLDAPGGFIDTGKAAEIHGRSP